MGNNSEEAPLRKAIDVWNSHENYLAPVSRQIRNIDVSERLASLFFPGEYYYYILDPPTLSLDYVSPTIKNILGINPEDFTLNKLSEIIHPDDISFLLKCEDLAAVFLRNHIPKDKIVKYKVNYCFRQKTISGEYHLFLMQNIALATAEDGALLKVFGSHTNINHITTVSNRKLSFIGIQGESSFLDIDVFADNPLDQLRPPLSKSNHSRETSPFSGREIEIIKLLATGLTTGEISEKLYISENTVETHRKNILKKSGYRNTIDLVVNCIRKGYI